GWDEEVQAQRLEILAAEPLSAADHAAARAFVEAHPLSLICTQRGASENVLAIRSSIGDGCGAPVQFDWARRASVLALLLGLLATLVMAASTAAAFSSRRLQLFALRFGWNALALLSAIQVVLQGGLFVWLSYWVTAEWFGFYAPKLI